MCAVVEGQYGFVRSVCSKFFRFSEMNDLSHSKCLCFIHGKLKHLTVNLLVLSRVVFLADTFVVIVFVFRMLAIKIKVQRLVHIPCGIIIFYVTLITHCSRKQYQ